MRFRGVGMRSFGVRSVVVVAVAACLVSCASTPGAGPSPTASVSATPAAEVLGCADLVPAATIASALAASESDVVEAVQPSRAVELAVLSGAGGLACSWRVGAGAQVLGDERGDWAYLTVQVLPDAADDWVAPAAGDAPSQDRRTIGGIEAATASGETGWRVSAPVGSAWVDLQITSSGLISGGSRFEQVPWDSVLDGLAAAAEPAFAAVAGATDTQLAWPALPFREGEARCDGGLDQVGIESALQLGGAPVTYTVVDSRDADITWLGAAAAAHVGVFTCELFAEGLGATDITVIRDFAPIIGELAAEADVTSAFSPIALEGAVEGESALVANREDGPQSPIYFTVGNTFYEVSSGDGPVSVAEAIIAQTR